MKNVFEYYKGYKLIDHKKTSPLYLYFSYFFMGLMIFTLVLGGIAIGISIGRGNTFADIYQISPVVVIMTIVSGPVLFLFILVSIKLRKRIEREKKRMEITLYIEDGESFERISSYFYKDENAFLFELNKTFLFYRKDIKSVEVRNDLLYIHSEEGYFITDVKWMDYF